MPVRTQRLSGWGRFPVVESTLVRPEKQATLRQLVQDRQAAPLLARGAGRSYGDAALNGRGRTVLTERLNRLLDFDPEVGRLRCEAGVTLDEILRVFVPRGWFLPVTPGTKYVTVGGAIAFDVHGKNHHRDGAFSAYVTSFDLLTATGETLTCSRETNGEVFWATIGGAGLTGLITDVTFQLRPIETAFIDRRTFKVRNLDDLFALLDEHEPAHTYSVAWIDGLATGRSLGRGLLMLGDHLPREALGVHRSTTPLAYAPRQRLALPFDLPAGLLNPWTIRAFNALYYGRQRRRDTHSQIGLEPFFYPLDTIGRWNRMYGRRGFAQYQCVVPTETARTAMTVLLQRPSTERRSSCLAVLKRLGPASEGLLSFPIAGTTLSLDLPMRRGLVPFLHELDRVVLDHGGRVYLAKDACLEPDVFRAMYPRLPEFRRIKRRIDPEGTFASALSDRLEITLPA